MANEVTQKATATKSDSDSEKKKSIIAASDSFLPAFHFNVSFTDLTIDNNIVEQKDIGFSEVSGIGAELQIEEVVEGGENQFVHRLPKPAKYKNLVLKKAMVAVPSPVIRWAEKAIHDMQFSPCTVTIEILDDDKNPLASWEFSHAYPVKLEIGSLNASKNEIVITTLELAYRYSKRV